MSGKTLLYFALGIAGVWLAGMLLFPEQTGAIIDAVVELTTSEDERLSEMQPDAEQATRALIQTLANAGLAVHVGQTLRSPAQEQAAIDSGHSAVKTHSWHEVGRAVDMYPIDPDTGQPDLAGARDDLFVQMQQAAVAAGFHQIAYDANWNRRTLTNSAGKPFWDGGHMEWRGPYATIADAWAAEGPEVA